MNSQESESESEDSSLEDSSLEDSSEDARAQLLGRDKTVYGWRIAHSSLELDSGSGLLLHMS